MSSCGLPESVWLPSRSLAILNFVRHYRGRSPGRSCASSWEPLASCDDRRGNTMTVERGAVKDLKLNEPVTSFFQVRNPQRRLRKTGEPFVTLVLGDGTGELPAVMWEDADGIGEQIREGDLVKVQGVVGSYQGGLQLTIQRLRLALRDFLPSTSADVPSMLASL